MMYKYITNKKGKQKMELNKKNVRIILFIILLSGTIFLCVNNLGTVLKFAGGIVSVFMPFIVGLCIAFVTNVLLRPLERLWDKIPNKKPFRALKKIKRPVCLVATEVIIIGALFVLAFMIIPEISRTIALIADAIPDFMKQVEKWWQDFNIFLGEHSITLPELELDLNELATTVSSFLSELDLSIVDKTVDFTGSLFSGVFNAVLGFVFSLYVLAEKEKLGENLIKTLNALFSEKKVAKLREISALSNKAFTAFVTGQLTEALVIGLLCFIGMLILRMPYSVAVSVLVGFTALIPVFGAFIGTGIGALLILMVDPMKALWFIIFIIILQQLEGNLIYPKVVGKSVGLPGIWVIMVVTVSGSLFGIGGMLVSIPAFTVIYTLARQAINRKLTEKKLPVITN